MVLYGVVVRHSMLLEVEFDYFLAKQVNEEIIIFEFYNANFWVFQCSFFLLFVF